MTAAPIQVEHMLEPGFGAFACSRRGRPADPLHGFTCGRGPSNGSMASLRPVLSMRRSQASEATSRLTCSRVRPALFAAHPITS
jgi:hypothetical protein